LCAQGLRYRKDERTADKRLDGLGLTANAKFAVSVREGSQATQKKTRAGYLDSLLLGTTRESLSAETEGKNIPHLGKS